MDVESFRSCRQIFALISATSGKVAGELAPEAEDTSGAPGGAKPTGRALDYFVVLSVAGLPVFFLGATTSSIKPYSLACCEPM